MNVKCTNCGTVNSLPPQAAPTPFHCGKCGAFLPAALPPTDGDASGAVGLLGGAALGAALGGPVGAIIGGILGGVLGKAAKGVG